MTPEELSKLLEKLHLYAQYEMPKRGESDIWSVKFFKEEDAEKARERLNGVSFKGNKLSALRDNGGPRRQTGRDAATTSASSSSTAHGPVIIDGSVPG